MFEISYVEKFFYRLGSDSVEGTAKWTKIRLRLDGHKVITTNNTYV